MVKTKCIIILNVKSVKGNGIKKVYSSKGRIKMKELIKKFKDKKHSECQKNGLVITGKFYQISINAFYCLMDEFEKFIDSQGEVKE